MDSTCAIILAAGDGTRMKSSKPKVLAEVLFKPMIDWVIDNVRESGTEKICVVTGHKSEMLSEHLGDGYTTFFQSERLGTGHAVMQAREFLSENIHGNVLVINGDVPFVDSATIEGAYRFHLMNHYAATVISAHIDNPFGYGRIIRDKNDLLVSIVEQREGTEEQLKVNEVNAGAYWFSCEALLGALEELEVRHTLLVGKNKIKEYYLTDAIEIMLKMSLKVTAYSVNNPDIVLGANDRIQLMQLNEIARRHELEGHMKNGVSIPISDGVVIEPGCEIGADTVILPGTMIKGKSKIGENCVLGPNSIINDSVIEDSVELNNTQCEKSYVEQGTRVGPFARIRPGCRVGKNVHAGNFVELKNSNIGADTKISHLTYIGDADLGENINIGCGCATVNYTGREKHRTTVEDNAFIGCSTYLVAPVKVGKNSYTAAGSVITEDVPDDALAIARARQTIKKGWVNSKKPYKWQK